MKADLQTRAVITCLQQYDRLTVLLREELLGDPEEEMMELYDRLRQAEPV